MKTFQVGRARTSEISRALTTALVAVSLAAPAAASDWRRSSIWDDGNAEFCAYEVGWSRYGNVYPGRAVLIAVKEPWAPELEVKADEPRADGFEVLKLNHIRDVPTGIYTYHQMASVFLRRDDGALRKLAATSSEGCGISTAHVVDGTLHTRSYFDGQGERRQPYPPGALPEDGLPLALRDYVTGAVPARLAVFPSLLAGRFPALEPAEMTVERRTDATVEVPAGTRRTVELRLVGAGRGLSYFFDPEPPHPLIQLRSDDGTHYSLAKCERIPYWRMHGPGDEAWLPEAVR